MIYRVKEGFSVGVQQLFIAFPIEFITDFMKVQLILNIKN